MKALQQRIADLEAQEQAKPIVLPWSQEEIGAASAFLFHGIEPAAPIDPKLLTLLKELDALI